VQMDDFLAGVHEHVTAVFRAEIELVEHSISKLDKVAARAESMLSVIERYAGIVARVLLFKQEKGSSHLAVQCHQKISSHTICIRPIQAAWRPFLCTLAAYAVTVRMMSGLVVFAAARSGSMMHPFSQLVA
jgi:hypothetical protein